MTKSFDNATYYGAENDECLSCETPEEYLLTLFYDPALADSTEVVAFQRAVVSPSEMLHWADSAAEVVCENFSENYGDPDGDDCYELLPQLTRTFHASIMRVIRDDAVPWNCVEVARREYSAEEIRKLWEDEEANDG